MKTTLINRLACIVSGLISAVAYCPILLVLPDSIGSQALFYLSYFGLPILLYSAGIAAYLLISGQQIRSFFVNYWFWILITLCIAHIPFVYLSYGWLTLHEI